MRVRLHRNRPLVVVTMRARPDPRRLSYSAEVALAGLAHRCVLSLGFSADGRLNELFVSGLKSGALDIEMNDAAVVLSIALQRGVDLADIAPSLLRLADGAPASLLGALVTQALRLAADIGVAERAGDLGSALAGVEASAPRAEQCAEPGELA